MQRDRPPELDERADDDEARGRSRTPRCSTDLDQPGARCGDQRRRHDVEGPPPPPESTEPKLPGEFWTDDFRTAVKWIRADGRREADEGCAEGSLEREGAETAVGSNTDVLKKVPKAQQPRPPAQRSSTLKPACS